MRSAAPRRDAIGPIDAYDTSNGTQLTQTLAIPYFRNNENLTQTATDLHAHRHTIRYRLEKIAEINGLNVFETEHKERLGLGLKAKSLLAEEQALDKRSLGPQRALGGATIARPRSAPVQMSKDLLIHQLILDTGGGFHCLLSLGCN